MWVGEGYATFHHCVHITDSSEAATALKARLSDANPLFMMHYDGHESTVSTETGVPVTISTRYYYQPAVPAPLANHS